MRAIVIGCFVLILLGIAIWQRPDAGVGVARAGVALHAASTQSDLAPGGVASSDSAAHGAAGAIRASSGNRSTQTHAANSANAGTPQRAAATSERAVTHAEEPNAAAPETPRPAGELFLPFIADDPNQVFAPATVNFHAAVQAEPVDAEWGPHASAALRGHITGLFGERFEIPYVDCRQDLCELQVAGRVGGNLDADMRDIQQALGSMRQTPWWTALQFDQESGTVGSAPDGRVIALWFFSRK